MIKKTSLFVATLFCVSTPSFAKDPDHLLTCSKIDYVLAHHSGVDIQPFCNTAQIKCRALKMTLELSKDNVLRLEIEEKLAEEVRYELDICEIAVRRVNPDFLTER